MDGWCRLMYVLSSRVSWLEGEEAEEEAEAGEREEEEEAAGERPGTGGLMDRPLDEAVGETVTVGAVTT